ncbi:MAG: hypothetical protein QME74_08915, partial [Candidatus Edwardsbacteria bacterium]|nr:hypothetical protein [Candidatus Edwardsbacteria bacterium]
MKIWTRNFWTENHGYLMTGAICLLAGVIIASGFNWTACSRAENAANLPLAVEGKSPFVAVAKKVAPAVVNIRSRKMVDIPG